MRLRNIVVNLKGDYGCQKIFLIFENKDRERKKRVIYICNLVF